MKNLIIALVLGITAVLLPATPAQAVATGCTYHWATDYEWGITWGFVNTIDVGVEVYYRNCSGPAPRHATPLKYAILCRSRGPGDPQSVIHNLYLYDFDGHKYNPHPKTMPCKSREWASQTYPITQHPAPRFHRCAAGPPRINDDVKLALPGHSDKYVKMATSYWGYIGPSAVTC